MPRSFSVAHLIPRLSGTSLGSWKDPKVAVRIALGALLAANLAAAAFAFHLFGTSAEEMARQLDDARAQVKIQQNRLSQARLLSGKVGKASSEGGAFVSNYMTSRRKTFSTILGELDKTAEAAGIKAKEKSIQLDPVEGSDSLSMMTISANFEGKYANLLKLVNLLDKSPRFLIIENLQAAPMPTGILNVNIKLDTFVRDDNGEAL
ncbi:MAG: hypothetical protein M3Z85_05820 [Acidobacteriota bacterium]|nr:hypothetical protein [Acidobacteriota bacterium]